MDYFSFFWLSPLLPTSDEALHLPVQVILHNSVEEKFIFRQLGVLHHTGHLVYVIAVHSKSACHPNFASFPWGLQVPASILYPMSELHGVVV